MRFLPRSLGGQLLALLLVALLVSQAASFLLSHRRPGQTRSAAPTGRPARRRRLGDARAGPRAAGDAEGLGDGRRVAADPLWVSRRRHPRSAASLARPRHPRASQLERMFGTAPRGRRASPVVDAGGEPGRGRPPAARGGRQQGPQWQRDPPRCPRLGAVRRRRLAQRADPHPGRVRCLAMAVADLDGAHGARHPRHRRAYARRATRPLRALAGPRRRVRPRGGADAAPRAGPDEVRRLTTAFNRMQERLTRFVADRTRMLAAIGHDLRTPITSLRLRAELLDDEETRRRCSPRSTRCSR